MSKLPKLPRQLKKREAEITPRVIAWFQANYTHSVALEVKVKGQKLKEHQALALHTVASGSFAYKIPDTGRRNPFDAFVLKDAHPFAVECEKDGICTAFSLKKGVANLRFCI
jgi:hypothetical protein